MSGQGLSWDKLKITEEWLRCGGYGELNTRVPYTKNFKAHAELFDFLVQNQPEVKLIFIQRIIVCTILLQVICECIY